VSEIFERSEVGRALCAAALALAVAGASGCSYTTMTPAHRLEANDVVVSGHADVPGFLYLPRLSVQGVYGVGGVGDISAHAGTSLLNFNAGVGARAYLTKWLNLELQGDFMSSLPFFGDGGLIDEVVAGHIAITPRLTTALRDEDDFLYGGVQAAGFFIHTRTGEQSREYEFNGVNLGGLVGLEFLFGNFAFQTELTFSPVSFTAEAPIAIAFAPPQDPETGEDLATVPFFFQAGVGLQYRF
jgi:hypothetical protein